MSKSPLDPSTLTAFGNAAAGHDGVLSDSSGALVIKPCTAAEIAFYESVAASHPDLVPYLPTFMGTLQLSPEQQSTSIDTDTDTGASTPTPFTQPGETITTDSGFIQTAHGLERLHGRKLSTELHIVLENLTHGFIKPNVLDLKLGAQLWDNDAKPEKRARLDKVSAETTSGSLGFRIAGMRTFKGVKAPEVGEAIKNFVEKVDGEGGGYWVYNKMYGRSFNAENVVEGFEDFIFPGTKSQEDVERAREVLSYFLDEVKGALKVWEGKESRMYSASILLVYEGDMVAYRETKRLLAELAERQVDEEEEGDEEDEPPVRKLAEVKMIDFAHATWVPGQGPDENALRGIRSTVNILEDMLEDVEKESTSA
ncbi:SAICAR synthase-like protein [Delitschia confertaspora ATCC 74209]|uniref:Kinase n=1 Tax=Delitschia confertaspora ATCC 74209 TaxID=1513339 RepID=A0A9P4JKB2_9PLEO|nr:SAICAR synthase-like protein [Delitschia confertaspora ATCC 74209]